MNAWACITTKNEAATIGKLVRQLREMGLRVAVADGGSTDGTAAIAKEVGAVINRPCLSPPTWPHMWDIGPCLMRAWGWAVLVEKADYIVQLDAGSSHDPVYVGRLLDHLDHPADVVVGSRFLPGAHYVGRPWRKLLSQLVSLACRVKTGVPISDWTSGYRAFSGAVIRKLLDRDCLFEGGYKFRATMHGWQIEVLAQVLACGFLVDEVPIGYEAGRSSFGWREAWEAFDVWRRM